MGIKEVVTTPRSPWQNAYVERLIGSIRRECLDHIIIFNEHHLRRVLSSYFQYHHQSRTHLSLDKDCPETRPIHPPTAGKIVAFLEVGGLHHRYERRAACLLALRTESGSALLVELQAVPVFRLRLCLPLQEATPRGYWTGRGGVGAAYRCA
jgi:transposase InsO family protein